VTVTSSVITLSPRDYDAVLFDLDGVLTQTARVHAAAWKQLFDQFLDEYAAVRAAAFVPFDIEADYRRYVDGKAREDGVRAFLESRGIELALGAPGDDPTVRTVHGLGRRKDQLFLHQLRAHGVERFEPAIELVRTLRAADVRTAVVSSSKNCTAVLEAAGITGLFDARVDGLDLGRLGLNGKPAPDMFLEAARRLDVEPSRAVVVEDAIAGVQAGRAGAFGLVIGVDHPGESMELRRAGADVVVPTLAEVWVTTEPPSAWSLVFEGFDPEQEGIREALCTLGNGYFATRAAAPSSVADGVHYPGTYLAGGYNRLRTEIDGRVLEHEDLVNWPNWLALGIRIAGGDWFDERRVRLLEYRQELSLRRGTLLRTIIFDEDGRRTTLRERRFVSMHDMHVAALEVSLTAENWSGLVTIRSAVDGRVKNDGARLYRRFNNVHLEPLAAEAVADDTVSLLMRTNQSRLHVAQVARTSLRLEGQRVEADRQSVQETAYVGQDMTVDVAEGQTLTVEKVVALYTSRDHAVTEPLREARKTVARAGDFDELLALM
jgi:beta-phosphoglucomutase family hydrolase